MRSRRHRRWDGVERSRLKYLWEREHRMSYTLCRSWRRHSVELLRSKWFRNLTLPAKLCKLQAHQLLLLVQWVSLSPPDTRS